MGSNIPDQYPDKPTGKPLPWFFRHSAADSPLLPWNKDPHYLKTKNAVIIGTGIEVILSDLGLLGIVEEAEAKPEFSILGSKPISGHARPNFYCEFPYENNPTLIMHADFEQVQFTLTIRADPERDGIYQVDEAELWSCEYGDKHKKFYHALNCGPGAEDHRILCDFLQAFHDAAGRIARTLAFDQEHLIAEPRALADARDIIEQLNSLNMRRTAQEAERTRIRRQNPQTPAP